MLYYFLTQLYNPTIIALISELFRSSLPESSDIIVRFQQNGAFHSALQPEEGYSRVAWLGKWKLSCQPQLSAALWSHIRKCSSCGVQHKIAYNISAVVDCGCVKRSDTLLPDSTQFIIVKDVHCALTQNSFSALQTHWCSCSSSWWCY